MIKRTFFSLVAVGFFFLWLRGSLEARTYCQGGDEKLEKPVTAEASAPKLPELLKSGWMLDTVERVERISPFVHHHGYNFNYRFTSPAGHEWRLLVQTAEIFPMEKAESAFSIMADTDHPPETPIEIDSTNLTKFSFRHGDMQSPHASSDETTTTVTRATILSGNMLLAIYSQGGEVRPEDIDEIIQSIASPLKMRPPGNPADNPGTPGTQH